MKITGLTIIFLIAFGAKAQNVNIPDSSFKAYLVNHPSINMNGNSEIEVSEAAAFSGDIMCLGMDIYDLTGIEAFPQIINLRCGNNNLTSLDVSSNYSMVYLHCDGNDLSSIDVSNNLNLIELIVSYNSITSLELSSNAALQNLNCNENQMTSLDVSANSNLATLQCRNNELSELNVANGNNTSFSLFTAENNPSLTCIQVDDPSFSSSNWTGMFFSFNPSQSFSDNCFASIDEVENTKTLMAYPNPFQEAFKVELDFAANAETTLKLFGLDGREVLMSEFQAGQREMEISTEGLQNGAYIVEVGDGVSVVRKTVVKM